MFYQGFRLPPLVMSIPDCYRYAGGMSVILALHICILCKELTIFSQMADSQLAGQLPS
jgi:hypothetical protein